ncbi:hypothetical protein GO755_25525 [Spirosoma sp. HMF4905]|uniref:Transcriptional regulator n=1 Tax=Spirosoma arboris TaxID=2682092 RepID=A0A7K1SI33_9BACT|nr:ATP-binding protein [Spirosoma arboris]MVM33423.1 hypothetical protein [Spirosoma arboris]
MSYIISNPTASLLPIVRHSDKPRPVLLLGAGASVKSGIPLAGECVSQIAKWAYAREKNINIHKYPLSRSDWWPWLQEKSWFQADKSEPDLYPLLVKHLLIPREERTSFLLDMINPDVPPSQGYFALAELLHSNNFKTVLTTNFDDCLLVAKNNIRRPHYIDVIKTESDYTKISTVPTRPQLIYIHGAVENYNDRNTLEEVGRLDERLVREIFYLLRDRPLIVAGYRGAEKSVMEHLLLENAQYANNYRHGIFWCIRRDSPPDKSPPLLKSLINCIGSNFQFIQIDGFDELFENELLGKIQADGISSIDSETKSSRVNTNQAPPTYDMTPVRKWQDEDLANAILRERLIQYCKALKTYVPDSITRDWLMSQQLHLNLLSKTSNGEIWVNASGLLLFAKEPQRYIPASQIRIRFIGNNIWLKNILNEGEEDSRESFGEIYEQVVDGNLWVQLNAINDILSLINKPYILKGEVSETVLPYPPVALKELIVNAIVHRDYESDRQTVIEVYSDKIKIVNSGGLVDEVLKQVDSNESIELEIAKGKRGIKGYRNPVIADLFYGAGAMEKKGSGLQDVFQLVHLNNGSVHFGPSDDNASFEVTIWSRPEVVDAETNTALPTSVGSTRYAGNIFELLSYPPFVYHAQSLFGWAKDIFVELGENPVPPFLLKSNRIFSFADLSQKNNYLKKVIQTGTVEIMSTLEFEEVVGERDLVYLFNKIFITHLYSKGLVVDASRNRAYFPKFDENARIISYQARIKRASRTVAKPMLASDGIRIKYWEHKAFSYKMKKFGNTWGVLITPGYVFTVDGLKRLLAPERVGKLSTKRASRDYNSAVLNDLFFWSWVISGGNRGSFDIPIFSIPTDPSDPQGDANAELALTFSSQMPVTTINEVAVDLRQTGTEIDWEEIGELDELLSQYADEEADQNSAIDD